MNMKRKVALAAILILSHFAFYVLGATINRHTMLSAFAHEYDKAQAVVNVGLYMDYRYIALSIKAKRYEDALCSAQLGASVRYDDLKECLASQDCKVAVEEDLRKDAPEVLGQAPLGFTYIKSKDGIKSCDGGARILPKKK